ncbi:MAG: DUF6314 family protein [Miltoncostaeaceae bacterium]
MTATPRPTGAPPRLLDCPLMGDWTVERTIEDRLSGRPARFAGTARIAPAPGGDHLDWREKGHLESAAFTGRATRDMRIVVEGAAFAVLFADGRPFHPLDLTGGRCTVVHPCGDDRYEGDLALADGGAILTVRWRVTGPAKDLDIRSRYTRTPVA